MNATTKTRIAFEHSYVARKERIQGTRTLPEVYVLVYDHKAEP